jgi:hypothetical protein
VKNTMEKNRAEYQNKKYIGRNDIC